MANTEQLDMETQQYEGTALTVRRTDREREFQDRLAAFDWAMTAEPERSPVRSGFIELVKQLDVDRIKRIVTSVHKRGYAVVDDLLKEEQIERARDGMAPFYADVARFFAESETTRESRQTWHIQNVLAKTTVADEIAALPLLRGVVAGVLSMDYVLNAGVVAMSPDPGCQPQGLHRDDAYFTLIPRPHMPLVITGAIALDDFTPENGGTQIVPGSNNWPSSREAEADEIQLSEMKAGSMLVWDGSVLHGGGANRSHEMTRRTITLNYARGWLRTQFNQYLSIPRERVLSMPPELQLDLGYHQSLNGLGRCDLQDPLKYLQKMTEAGGDGSQAQLGFEQQFP